MKDADSDSIEEVTIRVFSDGRCALLNNRWLFLDSQAQKEESSRCVNTCWRRATLWIYWSCSLFKFFVFYLGVVTLVRYPDSFEAGQAALSLALIPTTISSVVAEYTAWYDRFMAYVGLIKLLSELGTKGRDLLETARQIKRITSRGQWSFLSIKELIHCLGSKDAYKTVDMLESIASQKYHCDLPNRDHLNVGISRLIKTGDMRRTMSAVKEPQSLKSEDIELNV